MSSWKLKTTLLVAQLILGIQSHMRAKTQSSNSSTGYSLEANPFCALLYEEGDTDGHM